jgi:hypothetical protein
VHGVDHKTGGYVDIEDMAHEHLVNVLYKLLKDKNYRADFMLTLADGTTDNIELNLTSFRLEQSR